jgi:hypothetical protein
VTSAIAATIAAHLTDLAAFGLAIGVYGLAGESNPVAHALVGVGGLPLLVAAKVAGSFVAALIVARRRQWLPLAAGSGIVGAVSALVVLA